MSSIEDRSEIERNMELANKGLEAMKSDSDPNVAISDGIANLLILAHESDMNVGELVQRGAAHYLATYMEPMEDKDVEQWLSATLFPWTGDNQFAWYVAQEAIVLSGKQGRVTIPEWGM